MPIIIHNGDNTNNESNEIKQNHNNQSLLGNKTSQGSMPTQILHRTATKIYDAQEIHDYDMYTGINDHILAKRPTGTRSKLAYREILNEIKSTTKYLLPGSLVLFAYDTPKLKEELEYYDKFPLVLFFGIIRTKDNTIREVGLNLHYFPPFTRARIFVSIYNMWKSYFDLNFNEYQHRPNTLISYKALKHIIKRDAKIAFGIREYIPSLRGNSYVIPTRLYSTAFYTEGVFSKMTRTQIHKFWRQFSMFG